MSTLRRVVRKLTLKYFNWQLNRGNHRKVYALHDHRPTQLGPIGLGILDATLEVQDRLVEEFGYHKCPSCEWVTEIQDEHVCQIGSWCWEQFQLDHPKKFFLLEKKLKKPDHFDQIGVVVAESIEDASRKLGLHIIEIVRPPESAIVCAELENNYWLEEIKEITSLPSSESE